VNKVGPFRNPQETYMFYSLPYCRPEEEEESGFEGLGEALQGYELRKSSMKIFFKSKLETLCAAHIRTIVFFFC
jgi:transmembrane 9 superfamily protein 3